MNSTGTILKNKTEIPDEMLHVYHREMCNTIFGFQIDLTLASYVANQNKAISILQYYIVMIRLIVRPSTVVNSCNHSTQEAEAKGPYKFKVNLCYIVTSRLT